MKYISDLGGCCPAKCFVYLTCAYTEKIPEKTDNVIKIGKNVEKIKKYTEKYTNEKMANHKLINHRL